MRQCQNTSPNVKEDVMDKRTDVGSSVHHIELSLLNIDQHYIDSYWALHWALVIYGQQIEHVTYG